MAHAQRDRMFTFFMIPDFLLLNVICLRDLSVIYSIRILRRRGSPSLLTSWNPPA
jgi:hypothetical protein